MPFQQRDIVKVKLGIPNVEEDVHPFLIISCELANSRGNERSYTGVMMTHSPNKDRFTLQVTADMVEGHWDEKWVQIRLHLIVTFTESNISRDITHYVGRIKKIDFKNIVDQIRDFVFNPD